MKKGRSVYNFRLNCDVNQINQLVQSYMSANGYEQMEKNGEIVYRAGDSFSGYRYFNYNLSGNNLTIYAWIKGMFGEIQIEQEGVSSIPLPIMNYRNSLCTLFQEIEKLNVQNNNFGSTNNNIIGYDSNTGQPIYTNDSSTMKYDPNTGQPINGNVQNSYYQNYYSNNNQFAQTFQNETLKKQERLCEVGFWLSLLGLFISFFGFSYGLIVYVMDFYFASQGLKTRKKGKAIASIILSIISVLVIVFQLIMLSQQ